MTALSDEGWERWLRQTVGHPTRRPALLLLEGSAGTGKSRRLDQLLERSAGGSRTRVVLTFTASGMESSVLPDEPGPPAPGSGGPAAPADRRPGPDRREPAPARPESGPAAGDPPDLAGLLDPASGRPLLLIADDVHRAGEEGRELLSRLLERPPDALAAVLAYRPEELPAPGLVLGRAVAYPARLSAARIRLEPLDADGVRRMVEERLGAEHCPPALTARIHERSGGIPQVVADLVAQLDDAHGTAGIRTPAELDATGVPVRVAEQITARLAALPGEHHPVACAAAVLDGPAGARELYAVAGLDPEAGRGSLVAALRHSVLLETGTDRYGFVPPVAGTAVRELTPGPIRQEMHRRAAEVLVRRDPVDWARVAGHRRYGGGPRGWLRAVEHAARQTAAAGAHQTAIGLLEEALSHPAADRETRARLAVLLAHSAVLGLHTDHTVRVLRQILDEQALPDAARGRIRLDLGLVLYNQAGMGLEGVVELEQAVGELTGRPALAVRAMSALAMPVMSSVPLERNLHWLREARKAAEESDDGEIRVTADANCVAILLETGDPAAGEALDRLRAQGDRPGRLPHVARGLINAADAAVWLGALPGVGALAGVDDLLEEGLDAAARAGASYVEQDGRGTVLLLDWMTGHWDGLAARARAFLAEERIMPGPAADARIVLGQLALAQGEWQQMAAWLSGDGRPLPLGSPLPHVAAAAGALVRTALARDDTETAAAEAAAGWDRIRDKGVWAWAAELAPWAVEATARAGRLPAARAMTEEYEKGLAGLGEATAPSAVAALAWCRGVLAEAAGAPDDAVAHYREAAGRYAAVSRPYPAILTTVAAGTCALEAAREAGAESGAAAESAAAADLTECVERLTALGAGWDAARVRAELRVHRPTAGQRPRGRPGYGDQLSPREQEVVDLASGGLTNREIAATLHLSPRTVEQHVSRARRKLESQSGQPLSRPRGGRTG
ncbi:LuxR C-terminal-related transcriptional regulator [Streptomyces sp. CAU 1734]|uniref:helix-turn-helix transcriptional regulator n=1 Tax=Streptomyces sp. CAU 1734 TaxID=3140360 RepID=UPI003260CC30